MRWVNDTLPPRARARWLLMTRAVVPQQLDGHAAHRRRGRDLQRGVHVLHRAGRGTAQRDQRGLVAGGGRRRGTRVLRDRAAGAGGRLGGGRGRPRLGDRGRSVLAGLLLGLLRLGLRGLGLLRLGLLGSAAWPRAAWPRRASPAASRPSSWRPAGYRRWTRRGPFRRWWCPAYRCSLLRRWPGSTSPIRAQRFPGPSGTGRTSRRRAIRWLRSRESGIQTEGLSAAARCGSPLPVRARCGSEYRHQG